MNRPSSAHPQLSPIELALTPQLIVASYAPALRASNLGFSCSWPRPFQQGQPLRLRIPAITREIATDVLVMQCTATDTGFVLKLAVLDQEQEFQFRMLLQLSHIHLYHQQLDHQGRRLSRNEAAKEWIGHFADTFLMPSPKGSEPIRQR